MDRAAGFQNKEGDVIEDGPFTGASAEPVVDVAESGADDDSSYTALTTLVVNQMMTASICRTRSGLSCM